MCIKNTLKLPLSDEDGVIEKQEKIENERETVEEFSNMLSNAEIVLES